MLGIDGPAEAGGRHNPCEGAIAVSDHKPMHPEFVHQRLHLGQALIGVHECEWCAHHLLHESGAEVNLEILQLQQIAFGQDANRNQGAIG